MPTDSFLGLSSVDRRLLLERAALTSGWTEAVIEKDYWVCWTLGKLFALPEIGDHLTFKGGTSLSKVYGLIFRFSEDVDVSFHRSFLGFGDDRDPEKASGKEQKRRLEALQQACADSIRNRLVPSLCQAAQDEIGDSGWTVSLDPDDPQTVVFRFPTAGAENPYVKPAVRIELGARSDHWPQETRSVRPLLEEILKMPGASFASATVRVLGAERTFWEKVTLLHAEYHRDSGKPMPERYARHFYDLSRLARAPVAEKALGDIALRERVVAHKSVYFRSSWARYDLARPGSFRLMPSDARAAELARDYAAMRPMFFGDPPSLEEILGDLRQLEQAINALAA